MQKRHLQVAMDELLDAMEERSESVVPYFNQRTGEVSIWVDPDINEWPQLDPDDPDWVEIPRVASHDAFRVMERFVDGKTELLEGRVDRCIQSNSPTQARKLFERLAREIMELQGLGYRRSLVEGLPVIEVGPFRLAIEGNVVWLGTEVPREIWNAFL
jgi:hypothetical protein